MYEDDLYPLFLAGDKRLKTGCHSKSELVNEGRLVLTVDLNFDPSFKRRLICRNSKNEGSQQHAFTMCSTNESRHSSSCLWVFHSEVLTHPHAAREWQITRHGSQWMMSPSPVSPQTGRYSSCWMSSMSSSPLPIPPLVVMRGGRPSSPELKV